MSWFSKYPHWLHQEAKDLSNSSVYNQTFQFVDRTFVSSGVILVHKETTTYHPVAIVYAEATPYVPPKVYILDRSLTEEEAKKYSSSTTAEISRVVKEIARFHNRRHQNEDGSLCFIETGDLHGDHAESFRIKDILKRVREWLAGKIPHDSREVELFAHFQKRAHDIEYLVPDIFCVSTLYKGEFYAALPRLIAVNLLPGGQFKKIYIGLCLFGETAGGVSLSPIINKSQKLSLCSNLIDPDDLIDPDKRKRIDASEFIRGFWWEIASEPQPFSSIDELAEHVGNGKRDEGCLEIVRVLKSELVKTEFIHLGLRFPARFPTDDRKYDWAMLRLVKGSRPPIILDSNEELIARLRDYSIEAVRHEYFTEEYFHSRNSGRADRIRLKDQKLSVIGCGALGSEIADCLCKAGVGNLLLTDRDEMRAHNSIRHCVGLSRVSWPKNLALAEYLIYHNPFVEICTPQRNDVLQAVLDDYLPSGSIGISTIADDNVEAYLNENAVEAERIVFYCRALRGGKAGRIFRVIPRQDACKNCLSLYRRGEDTQFIDIPEDPVLPVITNECNNPVRPGSAADLKIIASLASRMIIDYLQGTSTAANHWIWNTEPLDGLTLGQNQTGAIHAQTILPHPECSVCRKIEDTNVRVLKDVYEGIRNLAKKSNDLETGGILIGTYDAKGLYLVQRATDAGPKSVRTANAFEKDIEYSQDQLATITQELGRDALYLGEWHYHPTLSNEPSGTDIKSLTEIAAQENYLIERPIMLIVSKNLEVGLSVHMKTGRWVRVPLNVVDMSL